MAKKSLKKALGITAVVFPVFVLIFVLIVHMMPDPVYTAIEQAKNRFGISTEDSSDASTEQARMITKQGESERVTRAEYVVLPQSEAPKISTLCSRKGPKLSGTWNIADADVATLESRITGISKLRARFGIQGAQINHPEACRRQYLGVIVGRSKLIYVNAFCNINVNYWKKQFVNICDGGDSVWGVLYDPESGDFSELSTNGIA